MKTIRLIGLLTLAASSLSADLYEVKVDTTALLAGSTGFLDFGFIPGGLFGPLGTATITNFTGTGFTLDGAPTFVDGDVSGVLPAGPLVLGNSTAFNSYFVGFTGGGAGSGFSFDLEIAGGILTPAPGNLIGTTFALFIFPDDGSILGVDGLLAQIDVGPAGGVQAQGFSPATVTAVPEPSLLIPLAAGLAVIYYRRRRASTPFAR